MNIQKGGWPCPFAVLCRMRGPSAVTHELHAVPLLGALGRSSSVCLSETIPAALSGTESVDNIPRVLQLFLIRLIEGIGAYCDLLDKISSRA